MTAFVRSGRPGWRLRTANPLIAGGPDPNAVIQIRDRLAAHAEGPAPTTRWCVCLDDGKHDRGDDRGGKRNHERQDRDERIQKGDKVELHEASFFLLVVDNV